MFVGERLGKWLYQRANQGKQTLLIIMNVILRPNVDGALETGRINLANKLQNEKRPWRNIIYNSEVCRAVLTRPAVTWYLLVWKTNEYKISSFENICIIENHLTVRLLQRWILFSDSFNCYIYCATNFFLSIYFSFLLPDLIS